MLQEHLAEASNGQFTEGSAIHLGLARDIRARVYSRVYHIPNGARVSVESAHYSKETHQIACMVN